MAVADAGSVLMHTMHEYEVTYQKLGRGAYGDVYLGRRTTSGEPVAVKKIELKHNNERQEVLIQRELKALGRINHPNVVKLYEVNSTERSLYIVMEYCEHSDLETYLRGKELSEEHMMRFIHQSAEAVYFMHTMRPNPIIHRDIKPANFLISTQDGQLQLKVADFGLARELGTSGESITATQAGTRLYMAPEVFLDSDSRAHYGKKADTFSLGIFILSLLNYTKERGYVPIKVGDECVGFWMKRLNNNNIRAYPPTTFSSQDTSQVSSLKTVAHLMLQRDPAERIDMSDVCQNIVRINKELGYENATRVQHSTLRDVGFVLVKLSSTVVDVTGTIRTVAGPYPGIGVIDSNQRELMMYNLNGDDDQINLSWKKAIPSSLDRNSLRCLDERGNIYMQTDLKTIHVLDHAVHTIHTLPARGRQIYVITEGFRIYRAHCPQPERSDMWKLSLEQSDGRIVHTFQDREYKPKDILMVVDPVHSRTVIAVKQKRLLQIHDATGALKHEVELDYKPGRPACTQDNIFVTVRGEARVEVYSWSGAWLYSLDHDELGIPSTADCVRFTPFCENRTLLVVKEPSSQEYSLHAYRIDNAPSSCVLTSGSMDTTE